LDAWQLKAIFAALKMRFRGNVRQAVQPGRIWRFGASVAGKDELECVLEIKDWDLGEEIK